MVNQFNLFFHQFIAGLLTFSLPWISASLSLPTIGHHTNDSQTERDFVARPPLVTNQEKQELVQGTGLITGMVFKDVNDNGVYESGDIVINWAYVTLSGTTSSGSVVSNTYTDASGHFTFTGLLSGTYSLLHTGTSGAVYGYMMNGLNTPGTLGGTAKLNSIDGIGMPDSGVGTNYTFADSIEKKLYLYLYKDINNNGVFDWGNEGIHAGLFQLTGNDRYGPVSRTLGTNFGAGGASLQPGSYVLKQIQPAGMIDGGETVSASGAIGWYITGNDVVTFTVQAGGQATITAQFTETVPAADLSITGYASPDPAIPGQPLTFTFFVTNTGPYTSLVAEIDSVYWSIYPQIQSMLWTQGECMGLFTRTCRISGMPAGSVISASYILTPPLSASGIVTRYANLFSNSDFTTTNNIANVALTFPTRNGVISGTIFTDSNDDGLIGSGEGGVSNATVILTGTTVLGSIRLTSTTDIYGSFVFTSLLPGTYSLIHSLGSNSCYPIFSYPGTANGLNTLGSLGGRALSESFENIVLPDSGQGLNYIFAQTGCKRFRVNLFKDLNNDGTLNWGEGLEGGNFILSGIDRYGTSISQTFVTDKAGYSPTTSSYYSLQPGTYTVQQVGQLQGFVDGPDNVISSGSISSLSLGVNAIHFTIQAGISASLAANFTEVPLPADLQVSGFASPSPSVPGQPITYTFFVTNTGPYSSVVAELDTVFPALQPPVQSSWSSGACMGQFTHTCFISALLPGDFVSATMIVTPPLFSGEYVTASLSLSGANDITLTNNTAKVTAAYALQTSYVTGTVTNISGQPLSGILVTPYRRVYWPYWEDYPYPGFPYRSSYYFSQFQGATTDVNGNYAFPVSALSKFYIKFEDPLRHYQFEYFDNQPVTPTILSVPVGTTFNASAVLSLTVSPLITATSSGQITANPNTGEVVISFPRGYTSSITITKDIVCPGDVPSYASVYYAGVYYTMNPIGGTKYQTVIPASAIIQGAGIYVVSSCTSGYQYVGITQLYDPSGIVTDRDTGLPIPNASVLLYVVPGWTARTSITDTAPNTCESNLSKDPSASWSQLAPQSLGVVAETGFANFSPPVNPLLTSDQGKYGWDVGAGCYYVVVTAPGYVRKVSAVVGVPPAVLDLNIRLSHYYQSFIPNAIRNATTSW